MQALDTHDWIVTSMKRQLAESEQRQDDNFNASLSAVKLATTSATKAINAASDAKALLQEVQTVRDCTANMIKAHSRHQNRRDDIAEQQLGATRELIGICSTMMVNCILGAVLAGGIITVIFNMFIFNPTAPGQAQQGGIQRVR
jgi:hypothetical protein